MSDQHTALAPVERGELAPGRLHPLVQACMAPGLDIDKLRELMALQREHEANEARKAYARDIVRLKAALPAVIAHDRVVDYTGKDDSRTFYTHASLGAVVDAVTSLLSAHGFRHWWRVKTTERAVEVTCILTHSEGHAEETTLQAGPDTSGRKSGPQAIASTLTLLQRYTLCALLGLASKDQDDVAGKHEDELEAAAAGNKVDSHLNLRVAAAIVKRGRKREDAEALLGRGVSEWTASDLERVKAWLAAPQTETPATEAQPAQETP